MTKFRGFDSFFKNFIKFNYIPSDSSQFFEIWKFEVWEYYY